MRVVIVGAGLSGLSLAAFLTQLNIDCVVLEQSPFLLAEYQCPQIFYANALSCFKAFGLGHFFTHGGVEPENYFGIKDERQRWLLRVRNRPVKLKALTAADVVPMTTAPPANSESIVSRRITEQVKEELGVVPFRVTLASDYIKKVLRQSATHVKFNRRVVDLVPHDGIKGGVHVITECGESEWGDIVVGADGMHSTIRQLLYPHEHIGTSSRSLDTTHVHGFVNLRSDTSPLGQDPVELWGKQKTLAYYPQCRHGDPCVGFAATLYTSPKELVNVDNNGSPEEVSLAVREAYRSMMAREFAEFGPDVVDLLKQADVAVPSELLEVPIMPRWYNRRAVLMGEAAHGSLPSILTQDASLCVEDAAVLAVALLDIPLLRDSGFEYAFHQYESVRRDRVERYIRQSRRVRRFTATPYRALRNTALRCSPPLAVSLSQQWLSKWSFSSQQLEVDPKIKMEIAYRN